MNTIETTIDQAGRLVIPKTIRSAIRLDPRQRVRIHLRDDGIVEISPVPRDIKLEKKGVLSVAVAVESSDDMLTHETVGDTLATIRERGARELNITDRDENGD